MFTEGISLTTSAQATATVGTAHLVLAFWGASLAGAVFAEGIAIACAAQAAATIGAAGFVLTLRDANALLFFTVMHFGACSARPSAAIGAAGTLFAIGDAEAHALVGALLVALTLPACLTAAIGAAGFATTLWGAWGDAVKFEGESVLFGRPTVFILPPRSWDSLAKAITRRWVTENTAVMASTEVCLAVPVKVAKSDASVVVGVAPFVGIR